MSFISLRLIFPPIVEVLAPGGRIVALIKPQFEVGKGNAPGGLVRDESLRLEARDGIVRFAEGEKGDQKRVTTPAEARALGSDYIVVGRPITRAEDPVAAYRRCVKEFIG